MKLIQAHQIPKKAKKKLRMDSTELRLGDTVMQTGCGLGDGDHKDQVEKEFERCCGAV